MVINVTQQEARFALVNDQTYVSASPNRPEALILCSIELVKLHARIRWFGLQIEGSRLNCFLLVASQARKAIGESVGDAKFHRFKP